MTRTYALNAPPSGTLEETRTLIGGKAANLGIMARDLGLPVPPGFVIATTACREYLASGWPAGLDDEVREQMSGVEEAVGRRFGEPSDPLLVSVRSGAPVSMPGMMDTILNLGLNDATTDGLAHAAGSESFAASCRERFEASFHAIVAFNEVPDDPWRQLRLAIEAVFQSWNSDRARTYRQKEGISDDLGTAVTVQAMVFGNRGATSATGVLFTRNPATGEAMLYGDVLFDAQGEDVVAGTHRTEPIAALDERLPAAAAALRDHARRLERHFADLCDIEFTIEDGRLWMLQVRVGKRSPQAALRIAVEMAQDGSFPLSKAQAVERVLPMLAHPPMAASARGRIVPIVTGLPASPGLASGPIATSPEAAQAGADDGRPTILVRAETSPEDVHGMARAAGILTSRGGLASHAAVVARGWGIPAVVGAAELDVGDGRIAIGERVLQAGDVITIDGSSGEVFDGSIPVTAHVVPEARILLEWAHELGIGVGDSPPADADLSNRPTTSRALTPDDCLRAVAIKGFAQPQAAADALLASAGDVQPILDRLVVEGLVTTTAGAYRLTQNGTVRAGTILDAERAAWGPERAVAALDAFLELDQRVKDAVTAWQLRDDAGVVNDHSDADYDRAVLDRLAALHADTTAWLAPLEAGHPRLGDYRARLARAIERAVNGDQRFVASPRVDSYHSIWFELHEDLIRLAGRTREEEGAAGRA